MLTEPATLAAPVVLHMGPALTRLTDEEFFEFCQLNSELRIERTRDGDLIIMPPAGGITGNRNFWLATQFGAWCEADGTGLGFDSSTGFRLPNGGERSPDLSWVKKARWEALPADEREKFPPLAPDFVVEIRSKSDRLAGLKDKMTEYIENGVRPGWLIDPQSHVVWVYRPDVDVLVIEDARELSGEPELPGFTLKLARLWQ